VNIEIERKFLVKNDGYKEKASEHWKIRQGFLIIDKERCLRIREDITPRETFYTLCLKISLSDLTRKEFEYKVPTEDGLQLLSSCKYNVIEKERFRVLTGKKFYWDIDEFKGVNQGLSIAEIELPSETFDDFDAPNWLGKEVTEDRRYLNTSLAQMPFSKWHTSHTNLS
jgi:CYTH domain-containing protein